MIPLFNKQESMDAYCVKCKEKQAMIDMVIKTSDSGRRMAVGKCPKCGTKMNRILGKDVDWQAEEIERLRSQLAEATRTNVSLMIELEAVRTQDVSDFSDDDKSEELIAAGYMTVQQFVDRLVPGLKEYLERNWLDSEGLLHPEDLFLNAQTYLEIGYHIVADFGVNNS